jgi:hypothetical protein
MRHRCGCGTAAKQDRGRYHPKAFLHLKKYLWPLQELLSEICQRSVIFWDQGEINQRECANFFKIFA